MVWQRHIVLQDQTAWISTNLVILIHEASLTTDDAAGADPGSASFCGSKPRP